MLLSFQVYGEDTFPMFRVINHKTVKNLAEVSPFFLSKLQSNFTGQDSKGAANFPEITFLDHMIIYKTVNEFTVLLKKNIKKSNISAC